MRLRDRARGAVLDRVEYPGADGRRPGGELRLQGQLLRADPDAGLVRAGGRDDAGDPARVRLEGGRPPLPQQRRGQLAGQLAVLLHRGGRVQGAQLDARAPQLQREQRRPRSAAGAPAVRHQEGPK
ncbi:hypothetical protein ONE63_009151 [Megalurothrips usitatus]|uniref:Uncharacterized protein n=1 Tax=Megalurothrips usitatus TaxID=439358 RepID=A0AAV7XQK8_9NEOP|nr:hypothetical protein ONE63_009151 [Megalurothrips usitatus]